MKIFDIHIKTILDSRGEPTIEAQIQGNHFSSVASAPVGKSAGRNEAKSIGTKIAIEEFERIKNDILSKNFESQAEFDNFLKELDGTENKSRIGANMILPLSLAFARAKAKEERKELFEYINDILGYGYWDENNFPHPIFNIINGGAHIDPPEIWIMRNSSPKLSFQEFQIIPIIGNFQEELLAGEKIYNSLSKKLKNNFEEIDIFLGDEAGFCAPFKDNEEAIIFLQDEIKNHNKNIKIGIDAAATQMYDFEEKNYIVDKKRLSPDKFLEYQKSLATRHKIISIEDPFFEEDFESFSKLLAEWKKEAEYCPEGEPFVITDDLTTTNSKRLAKAIEKNSGNSIIIKPNQIGTLTETIEVAKMAYKNQWKTIVSHRSGETTDNFIADLAVGIKAWGIKSGAPATNWRISKYNRLLEIWKTLDHRH